VPQPQRFDELEKSRLGEIKKLVWELSGKYKMSDEEQCHRNGQCEGCEYAEPVKTIFKPLPRQTLIAIKDSEEYFWVKKGLRFTVGLVGGMYLRFTNNLDFPLEGIENIFKPLVEKAQSMSQDCEKCEVV